jgi:chromosome condensin MukBEF ATPase and DNA-binding subunit MukB
VNRELEFVESQLLNFGVKKGRTSSKIIRYITAWKERSSRVREQDKADRRLLFLRSDKISVT